MRTFMKQTADVHASWAAPGTCTCDADRLEHASHVFIMHCSRFRDWMRSLPMPIFGEVLSG